MTDTGITQPSVRHNATDIHDIHHEFIEADWISRGACRGVNPDLFYPTRGGDTATPKAICAGCVVREQCLDYALDSGETFGIWGGKSERERRTIRRKRAGGRRGPLPGTHYKPIEHGTIGGDMAHRRRGEKPCQSCREAHNAYYAARRRQRNEVAA